MNFTSWLYFYFAAEYNVMDKVSLASATRAEKVEKTGERALRGYWRIGVIYGVELI